jgi:hypothetical protein
MYTYTQFISAIKNKELSIDNFKTFLTYEILKNYGHYILSVYGSTIYNDLEFQVIDKHIKSSSHSEIEQIISYYLLKNHKETLINTFGKDFYDKISEGYNI